MFSSQNIIYNSPLSEKEIGSKLQTLFNQESMGYWYKGTVTEHGFQVVRMYDVKPSAVVKIEGFIEKQNMGSRISMRVTLKKEMIALLILISSIGIFTMSAIIFRSVTKAEPLWYILIPIGMIVFTLSIIGITFKTECNKSKQYFKDAFDAQ